ncbi:unnamed protein product [Amoebophrya sp. A25]|nr:unnamed protein product [Amoebophrya sp. A25]|eukprot:GSA25T00020713001.1
MNPRRPLAKMLALFHVLNVDGLIRRHGNAAFLSTSTGSAKTTSRTLPLAIEVERAQAALDEAGNEGDRAVRSADTVGAVLRIGRSLKLLAADEKAASTAAMRAKREAELSDAILNEVSGNEKPKEYLGETEATAAKLKGDADELVASAANSAASVVTAKEEPTIEEYTNWQFAAQHPLQRDAARAGFDAAKPYRDAQGKVAAAVATLREGAAAADNEAFLRREQAESLGKTAEVRPDPWLRSQDVMQVQSLQAQANALSVRASEMAKKADGFAAMLPRYDLAVEYVTAQAAQKIDPSVVMPPYTEPLPPLEPEGLPVEAMML